MDSHSRKLPSGRRCVDYDPFAWGALERVVPTTEPQREVWLASRLGREASLAYNESVSLHLRGALDVPALQTAVRALHARHDVLRANFGPDGETLCVGEQASFDIPFQDLSGLSAAARDEAIQACLRESVETEFALDRDALFRARLLRVSQDSHRLVLSAHHIVCDGWSWWVMVRELGVLYAEALGNAGSSSEPVLPLPASFADYALAEATHPQSATYADDEAYWLSRFSDGAPVLDLPLDRPRPQRRTSTSKRHDHVLDADLVAAVRQMGARRGASLFATLLTGFGCLVSRLAGQSDVVVGIPAAGQSVDDHGQLMGHCVNLLPLRFGMSPAQPFTAALDAAQITLLDALDHQRYTFGTLLKKLRIERDPSRLPLVSVMFNIDQALDQESNRFPGLELEFDCNPRSHENFELSINAVQVHGELRLECQYNTDLFDGDTIRRWLVAYETLLRAASGRPETALAALPVVDSDAVTELQGLQPAPVPFDRECRMHEAFEAQCDRAPDRIALRFGDVAWRYSDLEARANRIAHLLREHGIHRGALVGLALDRGPDMLAALLGIVKAGAGYVPLDPSFPPDRIAYMAGDAGLAALLTQLRHADQFDLRGRPVLALDALEAELASQPAGRIGRDAGAATPESVAYVIYTSGSTGRPKGVQVPHRAVANFMAAMQREPGIGPADRLLAVTTLSFDIAVLELMLPLGVGAEVLMASRDIAMDGHALMALIESGSATMMQATPATWRLLLDAGWRGGPGFTALCGGEALPTDLATRMLPRCGSLWNMYGPTETTVWSTCTRVEPPAPGARPDIHIGRPVANTRVWIVDAQGALCPRGVPGEICIAGDGVTLGYLDRPELTAERFVPESFIPQTDRGHVNREHATAQMYRTGDRGRWRPDGNLEHLGRLDFQVKVRGYRIELGEIESVLAAHPRVSRCVTITREDRPGDVRLVAYIVPMDGMPVDEGALAAHLRTTLPDYMVPQHIVAIDAIPLLPNGKIDRKGLPAPGTGAIGNRGPVAPRNPVERSIAIAMAEVLGVPDIGIEDDFFAHGGHSLIAAQLISRLNRELDAALSLRSLFDAPTVARLAALLDDGSGAGAGAPQVPIMRRPDQHRAPLSLMQQRLWVLEQMQPGRVTYNTPSAHRLRGPFDHEAFERAFQAMVCRQASLRTVIVEEPEGPVQLVRDDIDAALPIEDLSDLPEERREGVLRERLDALIARPFDLETGPLFVARLYRLGEQDHVLFFMTHHIVWDGWSFDVLYDEMSALYQAFSEGRSSPLPDLRVSYGDFAQWHLDWLQGDALTSQVEFWKQHLAGELEPLRLPLDHPRPAESTGEGSIEWINVDRAMTETMRDVGSHAEATLFMTLLAAYYVLLHRLSGQRDLVVGLPVRNRNSEDLEPLMGFFVNMLPARLKIDPQMPFIEVVRAVRRLVLDAFSYPDVPFEHLVHELDIPRDASRAPIYQSTFSFQDVRLRKTRWGELEHEHLLVFQRASAGDLGLWFLEHGEGLSGVLSYNTDILSGQSAQLFNQRFRTLLASIGARPHAPVGELAIVGEQERTLLADANATATPLPAASTVHALLAEQVARTPDNMAIRFNGVDTRYAELYERSGRIASCMRARGIGAGQLVGVCLDRGVDMVASMIAVLRLGAGYVPLDPAYPADRLKFMAEDARLALVVTEGDLADGLQFPHKRLLRMDVDAADLAAATPLENEADADDPATPGSVAYVIYTSGSTGRPKGVQVPHRAVVNFLASMRREPGLGADDRLLAVTTTSFDIAVLELFLPLSVGAGIVLADRETAMDGHALAELIPVSRATVMQATPATWRMLLDSGEPLPSGFKALCGGEALAPDLALQLTRACGEVWNMYGPTETTVWSTCWRVDALDRGISIGTPIDNTTVHILDDDLKPCPIGMAGEICIGGAGVTLGYLNRPELTADRFVEAGSFVEMDSDASPDRAKGRSNAPGRLYRTGDLGRWRPDGLLEHLGRADHQIKLRGYRIELGEIEAVLLSHADITRAVVMSREDRPGDVRLAAYVVPQPGANTGPAEWAEHLKRSLPAYMLPQHFVPLSALPLLPNGKIDRSALPSPLQVAATQAPEAISMRSISTVDGPGPASGVDTRAVAGYDASSEPPRVRYLMGVWTELLGTPAAATDNFFDLGGHSMLAVQMANRVARETGVRLKLMRLVNQNLAQVASALPELPASSASASEPSAKGLATGLGARISRGFKRLIGRGGTVVP